MSSDFSERQLKILARALELADRALIDENKARRWEIAALSSDLKELIELERRRRAERKKSLAIERKASSIDR